MVVNNDILMVNIKDELITLSFDIVTGTKNLEIMR